MVKQYIPNFKHTLNTDSGSITGTWDFTEVNRAIAFMESNAGESMADAIASKLKEQMRKSQNYINSSVQPRHRVMGQEVANSLMVEVGVSAVGEAQVRFGSDPMDSGGVRGSRGGKLALILENGIRSFAYPFTFKSIKNSPSWGSIGGGFINAKGDNKTYKGFDGIGWLAQAYDEVVPEMEAAIMEKLKEDFA